jgi:amino acid adenylation domain-containing protein
MRKDNPRWIAGPFDLTAGQYRIWLGQQLAPDVPLYNMAMLFRIDGIIDPARFQDAFNRVVQQTDALRMILRLSADNSPQQLVLESIDATTELVDLSSDGEPETRLQSWVESRKRRMFRLGQPLFDSVLLKLRDNAFAWYFNQHHVITDATSMSLVYHRCADLYSHREQVVGADFGTPQYRDYLRNERRFRESLEYDRSCQFWSSRSSQLPRPPALFGNSGGHSTETRRVQRRLEPRQCEQLQSLLADPRLRSLTSDLTRMNLFLALQFAWLYRVTGHESLAVGITTQHRSTAALRDTAGMFVELFPVGMQIQRDDSMLSLIERVKHETLRVLSRARPGASRFIGHHPFNTVLNYTTATFRSFAGLPVETTWLHAGHCDAEHVLRIHAHDFERSETPAISFDFSNEVFDQQHQAWAISQYFNLLESLLEDPTQQIRAAKLLGHDELAAISRYSQPTLAPADDNTLVELFRQQAALTPDAIAIEHRGQTVTYREFDESTESLSRRMNQRRIGRGSVVAIRMSRSIEFMTAVMATLKSGAAYLPIEPGLPPARTAHMLADASCRLILTERRFVSSAATHRIEQWCLDEDSQWDEELPANTSQSTPEDPAYVVYTSGSTGQPKGVVVQHSALARYVCWAKLAYTDQACKDFALFSSIGFDLTVTSMFVPLIAGGRVVVYQAPEAETLGQADLSVLDVFAGDLVDIVKLTPSHLALLRSTDLSCCNNIRKLIVGGEDLQADLASDIHRALGSNSQRQNVEIFNEYGPTEATVGCTLHRFDPQVDTAGSVPIGSPVPHASIHILDGDGQPAAVGASGEIYIAGEGLALGYLNRPDLTSERFVMDQQTGQRLYRSGDIARWRNDGILEFLGRRDRQVKIGGARIELGEVESAARAHRQVLDCVVDLIDPQVAVPKRTDAGLCAVCGIPAAHPDVQLDSNGICNICRAFQGWKDAASGYFRSLEDLQAMIDKARAAAPSSKYDTLMLLSGGKDSTYALYQLVELGANPLVLSLDNGFISDQAKENIRRVVADLGLDLEFVNTPAMSDIFVDSLKRHSNVCNGCFKTIYTLATNVAIQKRIHLIITGLSRGQIFETRLWDFYRNQVFDVDAIDRGILEARKAYHRARDAVSKLLDVKAFNDDHTFQDVQYVDFYRYCDVQLSDMQSFLSRRAPWVRPDDTGRSTNCLINVAGIHVHQQDRGYHNYAAPYAWDVRLGHKTRQQAIEELDDEIDVPAVEKMLDEIGYDPDWRQHSGSSNRLGIWYVAAGQLESTAIAAHLAQRLPNWMIPQHLMSVDAIPLTSSGKIDRNALAGITQLEKTQYTPPRSLAERKLVDVWEHVFGTSPIGIHDDFFDLGGDSILNIQIVIEARRMGLEITSAQVFEHANVAKLAQVSQPIAAGESSCDPDQDVDFTRSGLSEESLRLIARRIDESNAGTEGRA